MFSRIRKCVDCVLRRLGYYTLEDLNLEVELAADVIHAIRMHHKSQLLNIQQLNSAHKPLAAVVQGYINAMTSEDLKDGQ